MRSILYALLILIMSAATAVHAQQQVLQAPKLTDTKTYQPTIPKSDHPNIAPGLPAAPSGESSKDPVFIEANSMYYDRNTETVMANGKVEIVQGKRVLHADEVRYHRPSGTVFARGNVAILEPDGNVYFADAVELKDQLKSGVVAQMKARLVDNSLFAAAKATKVDENTTVMEQAVYSPCKICKALDGTPEDPLWQIKASDMTVDKAEQKVSYHNARFEVLGVPVAYTPYLSHPTPKADNKSGFLTPTYRISSTLGTTVQVPYFVTFAPNMDITLSPMFTSLEGPVMMAEFRHLIEPGQYAFKGSITDPNELDSAGNPTGGKKLRWHIEGNGLFDINDNYDWGFNVKRASDDTYLSRYKISYENVLLSRAYVEGFDDRKHGRFYTSAEALSFQGLLSTDDPSTTPLVMPLIQAENEITTNFMDSKIKFSGNLMSLNRTIGSSTKRATADALWLLPYTTDGGHILEARASLRGDFYMVEDNPSAGGTSSNENTGRILPEISAGWRYPLVRFGDGNKMTIEPRVEVAASPSAGNSTKIPNEDSQSSSISDSNIFDTNHFSGYDMVETGTRINYGLRTGIEFQNRIAVNLLLGQNYSLDPQPLLSPNTDNLSSYVGRLEVSNPWLYAGYRFAIDKNTGDAITNEVLLSSTFDLLSLSLNYLNMSPNSAIGAHKELSFGSTLKVSQNWSLITSATRNLGDQGRWVSALFGFNYQNECVTVMGSMMRDFTINRDIAPNTTYTIQLKLKNLN